MSAKKLYEGMFLFDSNLAGKDWPGLENHVSDLLAKNGAEVVYSERWPDRKLAYEMKGCRKGTYFLVYFKAPPPSIPAIRRDCEISERILRLLVVYDEELVNDCEKRVRREITGSPEEIEALRERRLREAQGEAAALAASSPAAAEGTTPTTPTAPVAPAGATVAPAAVTGTAGGATGAGSTTGEGTTGVPTTGGRGA